MSQTVRAGQRQERRRSRTPWVLWLVAMAAGGIWWLLFHSTYFLATGVRVTGNKLVSSETLVTLAAVKTGTPLAAIDTTAAHQAIAQLPQIDTVRVDRGWPHTVVIVVTERVAVAAAFWDGHFQPVDEHGVAADRVTSNAPAGLVAISGRPGTDAMASAVGVLTQLPKDWTVKSLEARTRDSVQVHLRGGVDIVLGDSSHMPKKIAVAKALMANKYTDLDVSAPDSPVVR